MPRAALALTLFFTGCAHLLVTTPASVYDEQEARGARLVTRHDLAIVSVQGSPEEIGAQLGALLAAPMRALRREFFEFLPPTEADKARALASAVPEDHRRELQALAAAAGVTYVEALQQNIVIDSACTAFVASGAATRDGSLVFGRNMDFPPCHLLGPRTLVLLVRPAGKKAFVSVGWPGFTGVVSGMNEDGLCATVLINVGGRPSRDDAAPLAFVVREVLETCATVDEAVARLAGLGIASDHYVTLADPHRAAVFSASDGVLHPVGGLLTCSNGDVAPEAGLQTDDRARALADLLEEHRGALDVDLARSILGATYLEYINAQAMVFQPASRTLTLATGTTLRPAALQRWTRVDLAAAFRGGAGAVVTESLGGVDAFPHYKAHAYAGASIDRRYVDQVERHADRVEASAELDGEQRVRQLAGVAFAAALRVRDAALLANLQARLAARVLRQLERLADGGAETGELARAIAWTRRYALRVDAAQAERLAALERRSVP